MSNATNHSSIRKKLSLDKSKPTILLCTDSASIHTGLARVTREVFKRLHKRGAFNIIQHGWFHITPTEEVPWPIITTNKSKTQKGNIIDPRDKHGEKSFGKIVSEIQPDLVWAFHDPWTLKHIANHENKPYILMSYVCVDSEPMPVTSKDIFEKSDSLVLAGKWGWRVIKDDPRFDIDPDRVRVIPYGVDTKNFKPLDEELRKRFRMALSGYTDEDFVFGCVARNQPRKNLPRMMQLAWHLRYGYWNYCDNCEKYTPWKYDAQNRDGVDPGPCIHCGNHDVQKGEPDPHAKFYYHGAPNDVGWDLNELRDRYNCEDCFGFNFEVKNIVGVSDKELNAIYNCFDVFTLPTRAEGFGLPILEAMSAGLPVLLPRYSAYLEWTPGCGQFVDGEMIVESQLNCERIEIWMHDYIAKAIEMKNNKDQMKKWKKEARRVATRLDWEDIEEKFFELFVKVLDEIDVKGRLAVTTL